jgi:hypothetical protein
MFCRSAPVFVCNGTAHDNGDQTHGQCSPEHAALQMQDRSCKQAFEADVPDNMADREQYEDDNVEDEDGDTESL